MTGVTGSLRRLLRAYPTLNLRIDVNHNQTQAHVVLPGLRYEDIDYTGQPDIWRIYDMMGRVEFASFFEDYPFLDFKALYQNGISTYAKAVNFEIRRSFYESTTPKAPLTIQMQLVHMGDRTFTTKSSLTTGGRQRPSVNVYNVYALQHQQTRLLEKIPEWWRNKFVQHIPTDAEKLIVLPPIENPSNTFIHQVTVPRIDTDINTRTRCSSYVKYFLDNSSIASFNNYYSNISTRLHELLVKKMTMLYYTGSSWGDTLTAESWEDPDIPRTLHCNVSKMGLPVWYGSMTFHSENGEHDPVKSNIESEKKIKIV